MLCPLLTVYFTNTIQAPAPSGPEGPDGEDHGSPEGPDGEDHGSDAPAPSDP